MKKLLLPLILLAFAACSEKTNEPGAQNDTLSAKDSLKKAISEDLPPPTDIHQFNWMYSAFIHKGIAADDTAFDRFVHPGHGLWIIHTEGAIPEFVHVNHIGDFKNAAGKRILPLPQELMQAEPQEDALPLVNCDAVNGYDKTGCFTTQQNVFAEEKIWLHAGLDAQQDKEVSQLAQTISRTVVHTAGYRFYFSLIDGSWYLTFIDIRKPCAA